MKFLMDEVFRTPEWILNSKLAKQTIQGNTAPYVMDLGKIAVARMMSFSSLMGIMDAYTNYGNGPVRTYSLDEYFSDIQGNIWSELATHQPIEDYRKSLQLLYINQLAGLVNSNNSHAYTLNPTLIAYLIKLKVQIKNALPFYKDKTTRYHLEYAGRLLKIALDPDRAPLDTFDTSEKKEGATKLTDEDFMQQIIHKYHLESLMMDNMCPLQDDTIKVTQ